MLPSLSSSVLAALLVSSSVGCARPQWMCRVSADCGRDACVAGRCQPVDGTPAVLATRRQVLAPADMLCVRPDDGSTTSGECLLDDRGARLLLRFEVPADLQREVVEAYIVIHRQRSSDRGAGAGALSLRVAHEAWSSRSTDWLSAPRPLELVAPRVDLAASSPSVVRLDATALVPLWGGRDRALHSAVVLAEVAKGSGMAFALDSSEASGPRLEIYTRPRPRKK